MALQHNSIEPVAADVLRAGHPIWASSALLLLPFSVLLSVKKASILALLSTALIVFICHFAPPAIFCTLNYLLSLVLRLFQALAVSYFLCAINRPFGVWLWITFSSICKSEKTKRLPVSLSVC